MNTLKKSKLLSSSTQELLSFKEGGEECLISKPKYCRGQQIVADVSSWWTPQKQLPTENKISADKTYSC